MSTVRLFYLRHGETELNRRQEMQGVSDQPLNERGRLQLGLAAERLSGEGISAIYTSDLRRARQSAEIVARKLELEVVQDPRLREQNLGEWEGLSWPGLAGLESPEAVDRFMGDPEFAPPEGESKRSLSERCCEAINDFAGAHEGETVLVVSHGGPLIAFMHEELAIPYSPKKRFYGSNGGLNEFVFTSGGWQLVTFDETFFLRSLG